MHNFESMKVSTLQPGPDRGIGDVVVVYGIEWQGAPHEGQAQFSQTKAKAL